MLDWVLNAVDIARYPTPPCLLFMQADTNEAAVAAAPAALPRASLHDFPEWSGALARAARRPERCARLAAGAAAWRCQIVANCLGAHATGLGAQASAPTHLPACLPWSHNPHAGTPPTQLTIQMSAACASLISTQRPGCMC